MPVRALTIFFLLQATGYKDRPVFAVPLQVSSATNCTADSSKDDIGARAICPFVQQVDVDESRDPVEIPTVKCTTPQSLCTPKGDNRCVEVYSTFTVFYRADKQSTRLVGPKRIRLPTSCVCATGKSAPADRGVERTPLNDVPLTDGAIFRAK